MCKWNTLDLQLFHDTSDKSERQVVGVMVSGEVGEGEGGQGSDRQQEAVNEGPCLPVLVL
jgi:hypothetical protein